MTVLEEQSGKSRRGVWRALGWMVAGALMGQLPLCAVGAALDDGQPNVRVQVSGRDVSRHSGAKVSIHNAYGRVEQICNGACDDLLLEASSSDNLYSLRIVDAKGECVLCDKGDYVTTGMFTHWDISGADKLVLNRKSGVN